MVDLNVRQQVDFANDLLDLNPPERRQNNKHRPVIRLTSNLQNWLEYWAENHPLSYDKKLLNGEVERVAATHLKAQFNRRTTRWMLRRSGLAEDEIAQIIRNSRKGDTEPLARALMSAEEKGIQRITRYTFRHFMATRVRGMTESNVGREQRSLWLGHGKKDATSWYETHDPEFLRECARATDLVIDKLDRLMKRDLIAPNIRQMRLQTSNDERQTRVD